MMVFKGRLAGYRYETNLQEEVCAFEITSGESKGSRRESPWDSISAEPDTLKEVTDVRSFGWILIVVFTLMLVLAGFQQGRFDVALIVGGPFFLLPAVLLLIFGKNKNEVVVFRHRSGNEAFALPLSDWQQSEVKTFIVEKTKSEQDTAQNPDNS